ncbi:MAG: hypothetical protein GY731_08425 [Gammaproteobacteria bacterium]|nr:hypothetical protein [Gammaproteobacteria bacterium]
MCWCKARDALVVTTGAVHGVPSGGRSHGACVHRRASEGAAFARQEWRMFLDAIE